MLNEAPDMTMTPLHENTAEQLLQHAPIGTLLVSPQGDILWFNDTLTELLGLDHDQLADQSAAQLSFELRNIVIDPPDSLLLQRGSEQLWIRTYRHDNHDGTKYRYYLDATQEHQLRSERDHLAEELRQLNTRDPVTGLPNQRALRQALEPLVSRSRRYGNPLSIIKLDIAATTGETLDTPSRHTAWQNAGQKLKFQMRWADIVGYWDDGQFLFILPETPDAAAHQLADKICTLVTHMEITGSDQTRITLQPHCGIAAWQKGDDAKRLLSRADEHLQAARQAGMPVA